MFTINLFLLLSLLNFADAETWIRSGYWISSSNFPIPHINSALFTHLFCAFAQINCSNYEIYISPTDKGYISSFTDTVKRKNPSAKTILSIQAGEANSSAFYEMINQSSHRWSFINSSITVARQHGFIGIDIFDVFPSTPLILTMGAKYSPVMESLIYPVSSINKNFDWVHILSFDYHLPSHDEFTGVRAALYDPSSNLNTDYGIKEWIRQGLPAKKLVLGLPYHGYSWKTINSNDYAIGAPAEGPDHFINYKQIKSYLDSYKIKPLFNSTYVVNYCRLGKYWVSFDDVETVKTKVSYAKEKGLLGYSASQISNDDLNWVLSRTG